MIGALARVHISTNLRKGSYHRAGDYHQDHHGTLTHCGKLDLDHTEEIPETQAVLTHNPCHHCFPLWRGRRQDILNQLADTPIEEPA
jgi:cytosine/adenosine deaminase-related metal-dependent hydrolase